MNNIITKNILRFIVLILIQVLILNNIKFDGYLNPYFYIIFILLLPLETPKWLLLVSAFLLGLGVDFFMKSIGINAAASVLVAFIRPGLINYLSTGKDIEPNMHAGIKDFGFRWFFSYSLVLVFVHNFVLYFLDIFSFNEFFITFYKVLLGTAFTLFLIIISQYLFTNMKNK
ncbi:MAG: rod shape-determining protein MreD [Bacteroidales bacterium]|nr:rod shape-determining protein MreD [Bacteroidales bacterium]